MVVDTIYLPGTGVNSSVLYYSKICPEFILFLSFLSSDKVERLKGTVEEKTKRNEYP